MSLVHDKIIRTNEIPSSRKPETTRLLIGCSSTRNYVASIVGYWFPFSLSYLQQLCHLVHMNTYNPLYTSGIGNWHVSVFRIRTYLAFMFDWVLLSSSKPILSFFPSEPPPMNYSFCPTPAYSFDMFWCLFQSDPPQLISIQKHLHKRFEDI